MGFGREAEVLEPDHLRKAVAEELAATAGRYSPEPTGVMEDEADYSR
jgi:hypothetical protein